MGRMNVILLNLNQLRKNVVVVTRSNIRAIRRGCRGNLRGYKRNNGRSRAERRNGFTATGTVKFILKNKAVRSRITMNGFFKFYLFLFCLY